MAGMMVDAIKVGELDSAGNPVTAVYAKVSGIYAIYCAGAHVMVHFADAEDLGVEQRLCLVAVNDMRGKIEELVCDLLRQGDAEGQNIVTDIRRHLAFALQIALQGQKEIALLRLTRLHARLVDQKDSSARLYYLLSTFVILLAVIALSWIATSPLFIDDIDRNEPIYLLWIAFAVGGVGAFFSIAIAVRSRKIRSATVLRDNLIDGGLRVLVGAISAVILIDLVFLKYMQLDVVGVTFDRDLGWPEVLVLGIVAGFFERFVPDMLGQLKGKMESSAETSALAGTAVAGGVSRDENSPYRGNFPLPPPSGSAPGAVGGANQAVEEQDEVDGEFIDGCCDRPVNSGQEEPVTDDVELPTAIGGVVEDIATKADNGED
ncbi:hypothetical protein [Sphingorhabdus sp. YGSMI21]|uniref:hypothetical protein n=1 Tax=Sphingorhabdus sp. YGSMI21 TaxID=2077182 RepID=UPI000C1F1429|nr:hypothetical protein [Sphingorhabdus sp. YGSMI21]ATW05082.1 hypothetical protein CHN51_17275 [Sphingorhabdus sp. YGSMI21]